MAQQVGLVLKPKKAVFGEVMNAQLPVHATGPCVIFAFVEPFSLEPAPSSAFITFHVGICSSSMHSTYCIPL